MEEAKDGLGAWVGGGRYDMRCTEWVETLAWRLLRQDEVVWDLRVALKEKPSVLVARVENKQLREELKMERKALGEKIIRKKSQKANN